jgi:hypothetical protein
MHRSLNRSLLGAAVILAFTAAAFASQASKPANPSQAQHKLAASASTAGKAKAHASSHSATGTIEKYESNMLTLKTSSGDEQFALGTSARIRNGSKSIKADDLSGLTGQRAKVRYTESNGQRMAQSIMVSGTSKSAAKGKTTKG